MLFFLQRDPYETSPPQTISPTGRSQRCAAACLTNRERAALSVAAGAYRRRIPSRWLAGHHRAPRGSMAVGTAQPAIHRRQPAGRCQQYRHRNRRQSVARRLYAVRRRLDERRQRHALHKSKFQFYSRSRASGGHWPHTLCDGAQSIVPGENPSRIHRLCQGQSAQDRYGLAGDGDHTPCGICAPTGTPAAIIDRLNSEIIAGVAAPDLQARFLALGVEPMPMTAADFGKFIADETEKWARVIMLAGIKPE